MTWSQPWQTGVVRRIDRVLGGRNGWARHWEGRMSTPPHAAPARLETAPGLPEGPVLGPSELGLAPSEKADALAGGESRALGLLRSFLHERGERYRVEMSSPVEGWAACSRLSPHLAWGSVSVRGVWHACDQRERELRSGDPREAREWLASLRSFQSRLRWRCHFMQKLEDEPAIEFENFNRAFDGLRPSPGDDGESARRYEAWTLGRTGYPMVDACVRALRAGGWINFRMRAMLASFAAYHLWLHWREPAVWLARHFLDFEPGIHFSQFQMQSGTTGINTVRIYSPVKQALDQDPRGVFIRRWVPELERAPDEFLARPDLMPPLTQAMARCRIGGRFGSDDTGDYPAPIVDHASAYARARERIFRARAAPEARRESRRVYLRHGSRNPPRARGRPEDRNAAPPMRRSGRAKPPPPDPDQPPRGP